MFRQIFSLLMLGALAELIVADGVINRGLDSFWILGPPAIFAMLIMITGTIEGVCIYLGEDRNEP